MSQTKKKFDLMHLWTGVWSKVASNPKLSLACVFMLVVISAGAVILVFQLRSTSPENKGMHVQITTVYGYV